MNLPEKDLVREWKRGGTIGAEKIGDASECISASPISGPTKEIQDLLLRHLHFVAQ
jgi:3',5'-cyclic AMP phosphodiesterase CpdA